ncbi:hypothetical protein DM02DRAFT_645316 [Periconia macrospinosa]|uniref:Rhodopsin domain-containing protein n=1 Tax=Periconia macrospinosa TaxID=97972 RepID=A0A2V1DBW0_9PLEO|nr:hypothetical protein DM02DRAFT_645316 [Periconia macrospinosa]
MPQQRPADANDTETLSEIAVTTSATVLVTISVFLRYLGRWVLQKRVQADRGGSGDAVYGLDDVFNIMAVVLFYGLIIATYVAIDRGMGTHLNLVLYERGTNGLVEYSAAIFVASIFYNATLGMIKLSVLSLYLRILRGVPSPALRTAVWAIFVLVAMNTLANVLVCIFQCKPIRGAWELLEETRCVNINSFYLGNAITGLATDAIVYLLSIPIVKPLQMDIKKKLQLLATMLVGGFAVIISAVRLAFIPALLENPDVTMAMAIPMNWSVAEPAVGILVSSMPAIRAIRFLWSKKVDGSYGSNTGHSTLRNRDGQIQLVHLNKGDRAEIGSAHSMEQPPHNGSGDGLVEGISRMGTISRTTEVEVCYSRKPNNV